VQEEARFSFGSTGALAIANLIETLLPLVRNIALSRLIAPDQVGLVFSLAVVISAVEVSTDFGLPIYAVRRNSSICASEAMKTVQMLALIRSFIVGLILLVIAPFVSEAFHAPNAAGAYAVLGAVAVLRGFENLGVKEAMRDYVFWREAVLVAGAQIVSVAVTIIAALISPVFTCVLWGMMAGAIASLVLSHLLSPRRYSLGWNSLAASDAVRFGGPLVAHGTAVTANLSDRLLVGALLGPVPLAVYSIAYGTAMLPRGMLARFLTTVIIPVFVRADARKSGGRRLLDAWSLSLSLIGLLCGFVLCLVGSEAVTFVFGANYETSRVFMCLAGLSFYVKTMMLQPVPASYQTGKTWLVTYGSLISAAAIVPGAAALLIFGRLDAFLLAMTMTELAGLVLYSRRASSDQPFSPSLIHLLNIVPSLFLCVLAGMAFSYPDLPLETWCLVSIAMLAIWVAFFAVVVVKFRIDARVLIE
jgi:PST family polysaccharide transporter